MGRGINKVIILGNLGMDPVVKTSQTGSTVTSITVATSRSWKDKTTQELQTDTQWHRVVSFGKLADAIADFCYKGSKIYIEGFIRTRNYENESGTKIYITEIIANEVQFLDKKKDAETSGNMFAPKELEDIGF